VLAGFQHWLHGNLHAVAAQPQKRLHAPVPKGYACMT